jgi:hypothetical protein
MLPTGAFSSVQGLTLLDGTAGDADVLNASVLNASWDTGFVSTNIENINLSVLVADADAFAMTSVMPGTTAVNFTGTGKIGANTTTANMTAGITGVLSGTAFGLGSGYTGTVNVNAGALAAATLNLNGTTGTATTAATLAATSPTFNTAGLVTLLTVNANANTNLNADSQTAGTGATTVFNATGTTVKGAGNVNILGLAAQFNGANINASSVDYTGALTLTPTDNGTIDLSTTTVVTGVRNVDLSYALGTTLTLATANNSAAYGTGAVNVNFSPAAAANMAATTINMPATSGTTDAVTFNLNSFTGTVGALTTTNIETVTLASSKLTALTITTGIDAGAGVAGTQSVVVTAPATATGVLTLNTVSADSINTTGVTQAVTLTTANGGTAGTNFTGGAGATVITSSASTLDFVTTGAGSDTINITGGGTFAGGAGNDTYVFPAGASITSVTDSLGTDTLLFPASGNISTLNVGGTATPLLAGIENILLDTTGVLTVRSGQFAGQAQTINVITGTGSAGITLIAGGGTLNASGVSGTALAAGAYNTAAGVASGVGIALATLSLNGGSGADAITAAPTIANRITGNGGNDTIVLGSGIDMVITADTAANNGVDTITGFTTTVDKFNVDNLGTATAITATGALVAYTHAVNSVPFFTGFAAGRADASDADLITALNGALVKTAAIAGVVSYIIVVDNNSSALYSVADDGIANEYTGDTIVLMGTIDAILVSGDIIFTG